MSARLLKDPATASSRIFVGHLQTDDVTKMELEEHFAKYGTVIASIINRGFGFVQFEDEQSAQKAIQNEDGAMFKGRRIGINSFLAYMNIFSNIFSFYIIIIQKEYTLERIYIVFLIFYLKMLDQQRRIISLIAEMQNK